MRQTPIQEVMDAMIYRDLFIGKYGIAHFNALRKMMLYPKELQLDKSLYGKYDDREGR